MALQPLTKEKQESVRKKEEDKHCHYKEWNVLTTEIQSINIGIIQPHHSVVHWVLKAGDIKYSNQCAEDLCI